MAYVQGDLFAVMKNTVMLFAGKMDITGDDHVKLIKPISERHVSCFLSFVAPRF